MDDEIDGTFPMGNERYPALHKCYDEYLIKGRKERNAREAHLFALNMLHGGVTFGKSVQEIVVELEGELPPYWPRP